MYAEKWMERGQISVTPMQSASINTWPQSVATTCPYCLQTISVVES